MAQPTGTTTTITGTVDAVNDRGITLKGPAGSLVVNRQGAQVLTIAGTP